MYQSLDVFARLPGLQGWKCQYLFAVDRQSFAAGGQHHDAGALPLDAAHEPGHRAEHVLTVVQHQQRLLLGQHLEQGVLERLAGATADAEHLRDRLDHTGDVPDRRKLDQPRAVAITRQHVGGDL